MKRLHLLILIPALQLLLCVAAAAESRYVIDTIIVNLREQPLLSSASTKTLQTGDRLELLEEQDRFTKVRTQSGDVGWVANQYISATMPEKIKAKLYLKEIKDLKAKLAVTKAKATELEKTAAVVSNDKDQTLSRLRDELTKAKAEANKWKREATSTGKELKTLVAKSENIVATTEERDRLREERRAVDEKVGLLEEERERLTGSASIKWFLSGSFVLIIGWILGTVSWKKKKQPSIKF